MSITINRLHRLLGELVADGHGRQSVCIDKPSFQHNLESDGCVILEVCTAKIHTYPRINDDGGIAFNSRGEERTITGLVLGGTDRSSFASAKDSKHAG